MEDAELGDPLPGQGEVGRTLAVADRGAAVGGVADPLAADQERLEEWIMSQVNDGASLPGLYPPNAENKARYEAWAKGR